MRHHETGMQGVFLVAAEMSKRELIVSPTSRNSFGADILATDKDCKRAYSVQVKTNKKNFSFWLLNAHAKSLKTESHIYVLVNLRENVSPEYFVVPSNIVSKKMYIEERKNGTWYSICSEDVLPYKDKWSVFK